MVVDWEEMEAKVFKKHWERTLTSERLESYYRDMDMLFFQNEHIHHLRKERMKKVKLILRLARKPKFFTERQKHVISLLFGWNGKTFVGPRGFSDIARIMHIKQSVVYNHFLAASRKINKYYITRVKKDLLETENV